MSFASRAAVFAIAATSIVATACLGGPDEPAFGQPGGIAGRTPPTVGGAGDGGATTGTTTAACTPDKYLTKPACDTVKWSTDIHAAFKTGGAATCQPCHSGGAGSNEPAISDTDPAAAWNSLREWKGKFPANYLNPCSDVLGASAISGNLHHQLNPVMPPAAQPAADFLTKLDTWVQCGAPNN